MPRLPVPVRRAGFRVAHALLRVYWGVVRPHTTGVKCIVRADDDLLFVRHAYGNRAAWELPGGGIKRGEEPRAAVAREAQEELGLALDDWRELGELEVRGYGKLTRLWCYEAWPPDRVVDIDRGELQEARWFPLDRPPAPLGRDARAVLARALRQAARRPLP
jgi:8-oxo-dGTP pyrophosphatase MutT (NUDIX family)